jgi:hypothetical protein
MLDPDGNDEYWHVNKKTGKIKLTKSDRVGDNIWVMDKDGIYKKLHEIKIEFTKTSRKFDLGVTGILTHYANTSFPKIEENVGLGEYPKSTAFYNPEDNEIYVTVKDGYIRKELTNYFHLTSVLQHEKNHKADFESGIGQNLATHFQVYSNQIKDLGFALTEEGFQRGTIASALNYLFSAYESKLENAERLSKMAAEFNDDLSKKGFSYTVNYKKDKNGNYNEVESFTINKTDNVDGKKSTTTSTSAYEKKQD